jgi:hypothetical protein
MPDWILYAAIGLVALYAIGAKKTPVASSTPHTQPTVAPSGVSTAGFTSAKDAYAEGALPGPGASSPDVGAAASYFGQAFNVPTASGANQFNDPSQDTVIPGWLGAGIVSTIFPALGPYMKVGGVDASLNSGVKVATTLPDGSVVVGLQQPNGTIVVPTGVVLPDGTFQPGPTDPNIDPNYTPADYVVDSQIAAGYLATNETGTSESGTPIPGN